MAGMSVEIILCDQNGNIDLHDLKIKAELHSKNLSAIMLTYPSTPMVFLKIKFKKLVKLYTIMEVRFILTAQI